MCLFLFVDVGAMSSWRRRRQSDQFFRLAHSSRRPRHGGGAGSNANNGEAAQADSFGGSPASAVSRPSRFDARGRERGGGEGGAEGDAEGSGPEAMTWGQHIILNVAGTSIDDSTGHPDRQILFSLEFDVHSPLALCSLIPIRSSIWLNDCLLPLLASLLFSVLLFLFEHDYQIHRLSILSTLWISLSLTWITNKKTVRELIREEQWLRKDQRDKSREKLKE